MTDNFNTYAMLVMIKLCKLMTKHGIKPSLSKIQHAGVTKNGLDNITQVSSDFKKSRILIFSKCKYLHVKID